MNEPTDSERLNWIELVDAEIEWQQISFSESICRASNLWTAGKWMPRLREAIDAAMEEERRTKEEARDE